ncbi:MAG: SEC-C motif-containing protein [Glaciecola sp.]|jgi:SEC-C motif-containing protein|uniref:YchJ family protein n=1 Tax=Congregibacter sp. TaxID=2744308 RepID=UPI0039E3C5E8
MEVTPCHCQSGGAFTVCCEPFLNGTAFPQSAQQLMRSRYSAFVVCDEEYLLATWHPKTRPSRVRFDEQQRWLGLSIRNTQEGAAGDQSGTVEFVARFKIAGKGHRLVEVGRFESLDGRWYYLDGKHL